MKNKNYFFIIKNMEVIKNEFKTFLELNNLNVIYLDSAELLACVEYNSLKLIYMFCPKTDGVEIRKIISNSTGGVTLDLSHQILSVFDDKTKIIEQLFFEPIGFKMFFNIILTTKKNINLKIKNNDLKKENKLLTSEINVLKNHIKFRDGEQTIKLLEEQFLGHTK